MTVLWASVVASAGIVLAAFITVYSFNSTRHQSPPNTACEPFTAIISPEFGAVIPNHSLFNGFATLCGDALLFGAKEINSSFNTIDYVDVPVDPGPWTTSVCIPGKTGTPVTVYMFVAHLESGVNQLDRDEIKHELAIGLLKWLQRASPSDLPNNVKITATLKVSLKTTALKC